MAKSRAPVSKAKVKKKKKLTPLPKLKAKLWGLFSIYIRTRDADADGNCICCTTGKVIKAFGEGQSGHFFSQRGNPALIFEESNVHCQSAWANKLQRNNITWEYLTFMREKYGEEELERLASLRGKPFTFDREWLEDKIQYYKEAIEKLRQQKNLR